MPLTSLINVIIHFTPIPPNTLNCHFSPSKITCKLLIVALTPTFTTHDKSLSLDFVYIVADWTLGVDV